MDNTGCCLVFNLFFWGGKILSSPVVLFHLMQLKIFGIRVQSIRPLGSEPTSGPSFITELKILMTSFY